MPSLSELLQEVRSRAEVCLYSGGRVAEVWAAVMDMANLPLPPCSKYHHIAAETMVIGNSSGSNRKEVRALRNACGASTLSRHSRVKQTQSSILNKSVFTNLPLSDISPIQMSVNVANFPSPCCFSDAGVSAEAVHSVKHPGKVWLQSDKSQQAKVLEDGEAQQSSVPGHC